MIEIIFNRFKEKKFRREKILYIYIILLILLPFKIEALRYKINATATIMDENHKEYENVKGEIILDIDEDLKGIELISNQFFSGGSIKSKVIDCSIYEGSSAVGNCHDEYTNVTFYIGQSYLSFDVHPDLVKDRPIPYSFCMNRIAFIDNKDNRILIRDFSIKDLNNPSKVVTEKELANNLINIGNKIKKKYRQVIKDYFIEQKRKNIIPKPVDLGLSVLWSPWNLGEIGEDGNFSTFGWADPTGLKTDEKQNNNLFPSQNPPLDIHGTNLDIASCVWGEKWAIPKNKHIKELIEKCTFKEYSEPNYGVKGILCTGPNGNSIFFPFFVNSTYGSFWASERDKDNCCGAYSLTVNASNKFLAKLEDENNRFCQFFIRPIYIK